MKAIHNKILLLAVALVVIVGTYLLVTRQQGMMPTQPDETGVVTDETVGDSAPAGYSGRRLAGTEQSPLLDINEADYRKAVREKEFIVLYFYAKWCPICRAEFPRMEAAFDDLQSDRIIGFRVNFNDGDTDSFERELAREFGVAYQHTKVILKDGERIAKSPEGWDRARYDQEISKLLE